MSVVTQKRWRMKLKQLSSPLANYDWPYLACREIVKEELARQRAELEPQWVTDRDPDKQEMYLITDDCGFVDTAYWHGCHWYCDVVGWMPLPKPCDAPPKQTTMWLGKDAPELGGDL